MSAPSSLGAASKPDEPALVTALFARRLAQPIADAAVRLGIGANAVTVFGGSCWVLSLALPPLCWLPAASPALQGGRAGPWTAFVWLSAALLWCAGYILDVADGSVARMTGTSSRAGFFLDYVFHLFFKPAFFFSVGLGIAGMMAAGRFDAVLPPGLRATAIALVAVFAALSIPANGASAMCAAERTLCRDAFGGRIDLATGAPGRDAWRGAAAGERPGRAKTARTLVAEVTSYYLQGPFFAVLVVLDVLLAGPAFGVRWMPLTSVAAAALCLLLVARIGVRLFREGARVCAESRARFAGLALWLGFFPALPALCLAFPALATGSAVFAVWLALAPLAAVFCIDSETSAAAHVFAQDFAKGAFASASARRERDAALAVAARAPRRVFSVAFALSAALALCASLAQSRPAAAASCVLLAAALAGVPRRVLRAMRGF